MFTNVFGWSNISRTHLKTNAYTKQRSGRWRWRPQRQQLRRQRRRRSALCNKADQAKGAGQVRDKAKERKVKWKPEVNEGRRRKTGHASANKTTMTPDLKRAPDLARSGRRRLRLFVRSGSEKVYKREPLIRKVNEKTKASVSWARPAFGLWRCHLPAKSKNSSFFFALSVSHHANARYNERRTMKWSA